MGIKNVTIIIEDTDLELTRKASAVQFTTTNILKKHFAGPIGTTEEEIDLEVGSGEQFDGKTPLMMFVRNHDDTNYVEFGWATTVYPHRLQPEEVSGQKGLPGLILLNSGLTSIFAKANTAACDCEFEIWYKD